MTLKISQKLNDLKLRLLLLIIMKPITIADDQALEELSEIFKLDVNELRTGWGDLPYEISSDPIRMDIVRSMTKRARTKFLKKYRHAYKRFHCPVCDEVITKQIRFMHVRSKFHLAKISAMILINVNEI